MFTVMHQVDGSEYFHKADAVAYHGVFSGASDGRSELEIVHPEKTFRIHGGTAYVMNAGGATVGKYDLGSVAPKAA